MADFEYLKNIKDADYQYTCRKIYDAFSAAEANLNKYPDVSITQSRLIGESITKLIYVKKVNPRLRNEDGTHKKTIELQSDPAFGEALVTMFGKFEATELLNDLHTVRKCGNESSHEGSEDALATAKGVLLKLQNRVPQILEALHLLGNRIAYSPTNRTAVALPKNVAAPLKKPTKADNTIKPTVKPKPVVESDTKTANVATSRPAIAKTNAPEMPTKTKLPNTKSWTVNVLANGTLSISGYMGAESDIVVPHQIDGIAVSEIGSEAFAYNDHLKNVTISDGISAIRQSAFFMCNNLAKVSLPASMTEIDRGAFGMCDRLSMITVDSKNKVFSIESGFLIDSRRKCLVFCNIGAGSNVSVPSGIVEIGEFAFYHNDIIKTMYLPASLKVIGAFSFAACRNLKQVQISEGVFEIGDSAFAWCENIEEIFIPNSVKYIGTTAFDCKKVSISNDTKVNSGEFSPFGEKTVVNVRNASEDRSYPKAQIQKKEDKRSYLVDEEVLGHLAEVLMLQKYQNLTDNERKTIKGKIVDALDEQITQAIFSRLSNAKLATLNKLLDSDEQRVEVFQKFFDESGINLEQLIGDTAKTFTKGFLSDNSLFMTSTTKTNAQMQTENKNYGRTIGANEMCPCGSRKKYKYCCGSGIYGSKDNK